MKNSSSFSLRSLLALLVVLGLSCLVLALSERFYYKPICERYAESERLTYDGYTSGWTKKGWPAECFVRDRNGNSKRVEVSALELTYDDWIRWILRWTATIAGVGGSVWLATVIGGVKRKRKSR